MTITHIVKYVPQVVLNYRRKSTVGLNIKFVLLDLVGAIFSLLQLGMTAIQYGKYAVGTSSFNLVKFSLAVVSIFFDLLFLLQHFLLYKAEVQKDNVKQKYEENRIHRIEMNEIISLKLKHLGNLELRDSLVAYNPYI
jgi:cystinosin